MPTPSSADEIDALFRGAIRSGQLGDGAAGTIWDSSIVKIVLGAASNSRDLQDLSTLIGDRDESTDSTTIGDRGSRSAQRSIRRVAIMPPDTIRTLPFGTGLIMLRAAPPVVASLRM